MMGEEKVDEVEEEKKKINEEFEKMKKEIPKGATNFERISK